MVFKVAPLRFFYRISELAGILEVIVRIVLDTFANLVRCAGRRDRAYRPDGRAADGRILFHHDDLASTSGCFDRRSEA